MGDTNAELDSLYATLAAKDAEIERLKINRDAWIARVRQELDTVDAKDTRIAQLESDNKALAAKAEGLEEFCKLLGQCVWGEWNGVETPIVNSYIKAHPLAPKYVRRDEGASHGG